MVILRDMIESDIDDYVRWFTSETEWMNWDAPWENEEEDAAPDPDRERKDWAACYEAQKKLTPDAVRFRYEIEADGAHIGWVSAYTDLGYLDNPEEIPALGIDLPDPNVRGKGIGAQALRLFIHYYVKKGYRSFYTQTWSGNVRMARLAEKLGFREVCRKRDYKQVNGEWFDAVTWRLDVLEKGEA